MDGEEAVNFETTLELYSSANALDKLARVHGLYNDSIALEVEGTVGVLRTGEPMEPEEWFQQMESYRVEFQMRIN